VTTNQMHVWSNKKQQISPNEEVLTKESKNHRHELIKKKLPREDLNQKDKKNLLRELPQFLHSTVLSKNKFEGRGQQARKRIA